MIPALVVAGRSSNSATESKKGRAKSGERRAVAMNLNKINRLSFMRQPVYFDGESIKNSSFHIYTGNVRSTAYAYQ
jgi:hypothetical protein